MPICEQVSATSEWIYPGQSDSLDLLNRGPGADTEGKLLERNPAIGKFVAEPKASSITAQAVLRVVPP